MVLKFHFCAKTQANQDLCLSLLCFKLSNIPKSTASNEGPEFLVFTLLWDSFLTHKTPTQVPIHCQPFAPSPWALLHSATWNIISVPLLAYSSSSFSEIPHIPHVHGI